MKKPIHLLMIWNITPAKRHLPFLASAVSTSTTTIRKPLRKQAITGVPAFLTCLAATIHPHFDIGLELLNELNAISSLLIRMAYQRYSCPQTIRLQIIF